jgi:hypothetical protein
MREGQRPVLSRIGLGGYGVDGVETELLIPFGADSALQATLLRVQPGARSDGLRQHQGDEVEPVLRRNSDIVLEKGMILAVEPQRLHWHLQDLVLIGDGVPQLLSDKFPTDQPFVI